MSAPRGQEAGGQALDLVPVVRVNDQLVPLRREAGAAPPSSTGGTPASAGFPIPAGSPTGNVVPALSRPAGPTLPFQLVFEAQLALARAGFSPGPLDGTLGSQTRAAMRAFYTRLGERMPAESNALARIAATLAPPATTTRVITSEDLARLLPLGRTWLEKSQQERLDFESVLELVAEQSWSHPDLIRRLNVGVDWSAVAPGTALIVPAVEPPQVAGKAAFVQVLLGARALRAFDDQTNLLAHFPCSIARQVEKRPVGERLEVTVVIANPNYTFDPATFPESAEARALDRKLILQPGPNNPVGTVWIGLSKPGYGIHGTPRPEEVGRTESHGCFRLANWNAEHLARLVGIGLPVLVEP
ncbi:MAG TPA: L,D-transpeptidase [Methylomirabilota bacterium]|nr:L,D-transpeptidase [Methylomirabilota bacterium]